MIAAVTCSYSPDTMFDAFGIFLSLGHKGPEQDERLFFDAVCDHVPNLQGHALELQPAQVFGDSEAACNWLGSPVRHPSQCMTDAVASAGHQAGAGALVTGLGGDQCVSMVQRPNPLEAVGQCSLPVLLNMFRRNSWMRLLRTAGRSTLTTLKSYSADHPFTRSSLREGTSLTRELEDALAGHLARSASSGVASLQQRQCEAINGILGVSGFPDANFMTERFGLSVCNPLVDPELLEAAASLPYRSTDPAAWDRPLVRKVARRHLPDTVALRWTKEVSSPGLQQCLSACRVELDLAKEQMKQFPLLREALDFEKIQSAIDLLSSRDNWFMTRVFSWRLIVPLQVLRFLQLAQN